MKIFLLIFISIPHLLYSFDASRIEKLLQNKDWPKAESELKSAISESPKTEWLYSSLIFVLNSQSKEDEAIAFGRKSNLTFPNNKDIQKNLAYAYFNYGLKFLSNKLFAEAEGYLKLSYSLEKKDFILFQLAIALREQNKFEESLSFLEEGIKLFPNTKYITDTYPYTRFLKFNFILKNSKSPYTEVKSEIAKILDLLDKNEKFRDQYYYQRIFVKGLETIGDIGYHKIIFEKLIQILPNDPDVYDHYGFTYYTIKSKDGIPSKEDRMIAINLRRKAIELYESEFPQRQTIFNMSPPLNGRFLVIADFGGSAMTHNGFAKYCYDFMAVNEKGELFKAGTSGKSNSDYYNFDLPLYAIDDGEVIDVLNTEPDNLPGQTASSGNYITIQHNGYTSFYAHTKQNSIPLTIGAKVKKGNVVGKAGNSGMSRESHLHFCLNDSNWVSLPFRFKPHKKWYQSIVKLDNDPLREGEIVEFSLD